MMKLVVFSCLVAAVCGSGAFIAPYAAPLAYSAAYLAPYNYRGPLSLAPGQPANILGADGRPLDTLDVNLDRSAHYTAKAFSGAGYHLLKKRSAQLLAAPLTYSSGSLLPYSAHYTGHIVAAPIATYAPYSSHYGYGYSAPLLRHY